MKLTPALLATAGMLALPAAADAYVLGMHPDGVLDDGTSTQCADGCTLVQTVLANEPLAVQERGVVVGWHVRGDGGDARLRRLTIGANGKATARAATAWARLSGAAQQHAASLPVQAGDVLGVDLADGAAIDSQESIGGFGDELQRWPALVDGTAAAPTATVAAFIALQAVVEPDADGDGLGDETQDSCVNCGGGAPGGGDPGAGGGTPGGAAPGGGSPDGSTPAPHLEDPYAAIRKSGPRAKIARSATRTRRKVAVTVTNPYEFAIKGKLQLKRGRKVVAKASLRLASGATRTVKLRVRRPSRKLTAVATLRGPIGGSRTTKRTVKITKSNKRARTKPKRGQGGNGGIDGSYKGEGAGADWVMVIENGVVINFTGSISTYCTKAGRQQSHTFGMIGDDPEPHVAADGTFAWEATSGYGFDKLKFDGRVSANGRITGKMAVESRPPLSGADPVTGRPRIEFEYCFAGREYTLTKK